MSRNLIKHFILLSLRISLASDKVGDIIKELSERRFYERKFKFVKN